jgi:hypothetical protein
MSMGLLCALMTAQSVSQTVLHADHVVVLKRERTLELLTQGKVIRSIRSRSEAILSEPRPGREITRRPKECTF